MDRVPFDPKISFSTETTISETIQFIHPYGHFGTIHETRSDYDNNRAFGVNGDLPVGQLGIKILNWLTFEEGEYYDINSGQILKIPEYMMDNILISVDQAKNIVLTKVAGRNGTVKTYIGMDDFEIKCEGYLVPSKARNGVYPERKVRNFLQSILYKPITLKINCPYLNNMFKIHYVVVKDFNFEQTEGSYSYQKFTMTMLSDGESGIGNSPYIS